MKVLFVIPGLRATSPICWLVALIGQLSAKDKITIYSLDKVCHSKELESTLSKMGVSVVHGKGNGLIGLLNNIHHLRRIISSKEYSTVVSMLLRPDIVTIFCSGIRRYSTIRNSVTEEYRHSNNWLMAKLITLLHIISLKFKDGCIVMSDGMEFKLNSAGVHKTTIIPNSLDTTKVKMSRAVNLLNDERYASPVPTIIIVGSLIKRKKVVESIFIFSELFRRGYRFNVEILGEGPLRGQIETTLRSLPPEYSQSIKLLGHVKNPIPAIVKCDVFFMNSSCEGVSRSLLEAAYLNKVLIVRENDGVNDLIEAGSKCYKFFDDDGAQKILERFLRDKSNFAHSSLPERYHLNNAAVAYRNLLGL